MQNAVKQRILELCQAEDCVIQEKISSLWSGHGQIARIKLQQSQLGLEYVVIKQAQLQQQQRHPRGWNSELALKRKQRSYDNEVLWYQQYNRFSDPHWRTPHCLGSEQQGSQWLMLLEDLEQSGFKAASMQPEPGQVQLCLQNLAYMHAYFLGKTTNRLWPRAGYWHLATRPDEWQAMQDKQLKMQAKAIEDHLHSSDYNTLLHGDAKIANFYLRANQACLFDFQYAGNGPGIKDVAYFLGSIYTSEQLQQHADAALEFYFSQLQQALLHYKQSINFNALKQQWIERYSWAHCDFYRFLNGWCPQHKKVNAYLLKQSTIVNTKLTRA